MNKLDMENIREKKYYNGKLTIYRLELNKEEDNRGMWKIVKHTIPMIKEEIVGIEGNMEFAAGSSFRLSNDMTTTLYNFSVDDKWQTKKTVFIGTLEESKVYCEIQDIKITSDRIEDVAKIGYLGEYESEPYKTVRVRLAQKWEEVE